MTTAVEHYQKLLAKHYTWMSGGLVAQHHAMRAVFKEWEIKPFSKGYAADLGAGAGAQSIPLAEFGFKVMAVDTSKELLAELKASHDSLPIQCCVGDMVEFCQHFNDPIELAVCMGDSLTHLESFDQLKLMLSRLYQGLEPKGKILLRWRDLSTERFDLDRFIEVRSDEGLIFTCFLEYEAEHIKVFDLVYDKQIQSINNTLPWKLNKSFYRKLRLSAPQVNASLEMAGFKIERLEQQMGLITLLARK